MSHRRLHAVVHRPAKRALHRRAAHRVGRRLRTFTRGPGLRRTLYLITMALVAGTNAAATWTINHHTWPAAVLAATNALSSLLVITGTTELLRTKKQP